MTTGNNPAQSTTTNSNLGDGGTDVTRASEHESTSSRVKMPLVDTLRRYFNQNLEVA